MKPDKFFAIITRYSFYCLFFAVPLILTPYNYELFEFNKMMLVYSLTVIIAGSWIAGWIVQKKVVIEKTPLDLVIGLFLGSQIISTVFSIDLHTSLWGYYSRFHGGLLSTISYIVLYYAFVTNMGTKFTKDNKIKNKQFNNLAIEQSSNVIYCLFVLLASAALVTFYGILEHFGIDAGYWVQDVKNRVFSTLGQPNWLGAWIDGLILIPVALGLAKKPLYFILSFLFFLCLVFTGSRSAFIGFGAGIAAFILLLTLRNLKLFSAILVSIIGITLAFILIAKPFAPAPRPANIAPLAQTISSSQEIRKVVWQGAINVWKHWPVFGSGVETFAYSYYNYRPQAHNMLSEWDFLYNKAHNEYLNYLATTGIVGLGTYLLVIGYFLFWFIRSLNIKHQIAKTKSKLKVLNFELGSDICTLKFALIAGFVSILVTNFFGFSVVPVAILFWLFPAMVFALNKKSEDPKKTAVKTLSSFQYVILGLVVITLGFFQFNIAKLWWADYKFAAARKYASSDYLLQAHQNYLDATELNPNEPVFVSSFAENAAGIALAYHNKDASTSSQLVNEVGQLAADQARKSMQMNPVNLNLYKSAAKTFIYLGQIDPKYNSEAIRILETATKMSPTDPKLFLNIAMVQAQISNNDEAIKNLEKTVELKPNYTLAQLTLAKMYDQTGQKEKAIDTLKFILEKVEYGNEEAKGLLDLWQKKAG